MSWEDLRSVRKDPMSMEWNRRKEWSVGGGSGVGFIESLVQTGKWSDGDQWVKETAGASEVSAECGFVMVETLTCWARLKEERDRKWEVKWSAGLSRWMSNVCYCSSRPWTASIFLFSSFDSRLPTVAKCRHFVVNTELQNSEKNTAEVCQKSCNWFWCFEDVSRQTNAVASVFGAPCKCYMLIIN